MIKFCSIPAKGMELWEGYHLYVYGLKDFWLENPEEGKNGYLKPYIYDSFLKYCLYRDVAIEPHAYGHEHAVITFVTQQPIMGVESWDFKRILNIYVDVPEAPEFHYLHIARIYQDWTTIDVAFKDGSIEQINMEIFQPYRTRTTKPLPPEQKVQTVKVLNVNLEKTKILQEV